MRQLFFTAVTKCFALFMLLSCVTACANVVPETVTEPRCAKLEAEAMEQLNCEFKAMSFDVKVEIKEFTIAGKRQEIKTVKLNDPDGTHAALSELAKKHVDFKVIRILMPGTVVTMEYREDRINFQFDEQGLPKNVSRG